MENKKFYWIKLRTDFFNRDDIDFLLSQDNGCQYVVLYQMLCLNTANSNGRLETKMNEVIIPYDVKKIARDTKYFDTDTIIVALELYKKLGLIYEEGDNILKISNLESMVGSESANREAIKKRQQRLKLKLGTQEGTNCPIENRDKNIDIDKKRFIKPTINEIQEYCIDRKNGINANAFYDFYESKNWYVGKNKMKDWKACVRTWEQRNKKNTKVVPEWFNKEIEESELSEQDDEEFAKFIEEFRK